MLLLVVVVVKQGFFFLYLHFFSFRPFSFSFFFASNIFFPFLSFFSRATTFFSQPYLEVDPVQVVGVAR